MMTRRTLVIVVAIAGMLGLGLFAGFTASARATARACSGSSYSDPTGDQPSGLPDITGVCIAPGVTSPLGPELSIEVDATGLADFIKNVPAGEDHGLWINIDADNNPATGDPSGTDYAIAVENVAGMPTIWVSEWVGGGWQVQNSVTGPMFSLNNDSFTGTIGTADLGHTTHFTFYVATGKALPEEGHFETILPEDRAPDTGTWDYTVTTPPPPTTTTTTKPVGGTPPPTSTKSHSICKPHHKSTKKHPCRHK